MAKVGTVLKMLTKNSKGKIIEKTITGANPEASDKNLKDFAKGLNALSTDTLKGLQKMNTDDVDLSGD